MNILSIINKGDNRTINVKKNMLGSLLIKAISILVSLALVPLTIGYVSAELYGVWLTLSSILTWISFLDFGFGQGLKNKLTEALANEDYYKGQSLVSTTYFMMVVIFVPVSILLEILATFVNWSEFLNIDPVYNSQVQSVMVVLIAFVCLQMIVNVFTSIVAAHQKVALSNLFGTIGSVLSLLAVVILRKVCPPSLMALALSVGLIPIVVVFVASVIFFKTRFKKVAPNIKSISRSELPDLLGLGYKFFIANIQAVVLYQATNFLISNISSPLEVTHYNIAYRYLNVGMLLFTLMTTPLWPAYTDAYTKGDMEWMKNTKKRMVKIWSLSVGILFFMVVISKFIYNIWIGDDVQVPFIMTCMVGLYVSVYCWVNLNGTIIAGIGKLYISTIFLVIGMIVHIPFSYFLSTFCGVYGILISMISVNLMYGIVYSIQVNKILNKTAKWKWLE